MLFEDLSQRLEFTEWMDEPSSEADLHACLSDLEEVNALMLVHRPTLRWLRETCAAHTRPLHIVDVGCGGGDMLRAIERWAAEHSIAVELTGVDANASGLRFARSHTRLSSRIRYVQGFAGSELALENVDVVISAHLTHHLTDEQIVAFLAWMERCTRVGWFINDLHRERVPSLAFFVLARCVGWHPFIQHDGPISVLRSFRPQDWERYLADASIEGARLRTAPPGRLCVARTKQRA